MVTVTRPVPTRVLHMTRIERLPSLVHHGLLSDNECRRRQIAGVEIGYSHVKERRARRNVPCGAGGTLADYVPFYYAPRSPMLFAVTNGQVSLEAARTEEIIYLAGSTQAFRESGLTVVASNRHAELGYAEFTDHDGDLENDDFVDWPLMLEKYWNNVPKYPDRKERRQAECLVRPSVPWSALIGVATKDGSTSRRAREILDSCGATTPVAAVPSWYF